MLEAREVLAAIASSVNRLNATCYKCGEKKRFFFFSFFLSLLTMKKLSSAEATYLGIQGNFFFLHCFQTGGLHKQCQSSMSAGRTLSQHLALVLVLLMYSALAKALGSENEDRGGPHLYHHPQADQ